MSLQLKTVFCISLLFAMSQFGSLPSLTQHAYGLCIYLHGCKRSLLTSSICVIIYYFCFVCLFARSHISKYKHGSLLRMFQAVCFKMHHHFKIPRVYFMCKIYVICSDKYSQEYCFLVDLLSAIRVFIERFACYCALNMSLFTFIIFVLIFTFSLRLIQFPNLILLL